MLNSLIQTLLIVIVTYLILRKVQKECGRMVQQVDFNVDRINEFVESLSDVSSLTDIIPNLGTDFEIFDEKVRELRASSHTLTRVIKDSMASAESVLNAQTVLKGLSDRITSGDAQTLLSVLLAYSQRVPRKRENEAFHRHVNGICKALKDHVDEEVKNSLVKAQAKLNLNKPSEPNEVDDEKPF